MCSCSLKTSCSSGEVLKAEWVPSLEPEVQQAAVQLLQPDVVQHNKAAMELHVVIWLLMLGSHVCTLSMHTCLMCSPCELKHFCPRTPLAETAPSPSSL